MQILTSLRDTYRVVSLNERDMILVIWNFPLEFTAVWSHWRYTCIPYLLVNETVRSLPTLNTISKWPFLWMSLTHISHIFLFEVVHENERFFFFTPFNNMKPWWRIISDVVKLDSGKQNCHEQAILVLLFHKCVTSSIPFSKYNSLIFSPANLLFPWACWYLWGCFLSISVVGEVDLSLKSISRYTVT